MANAETDRLVAELETLPDYHGWTFVYEYPGYFGYRRGAYTVFFTPDWEGKGTLPIEVHDDEGRVHDAYSARLPLPRAGRTGRKLFDLVRPTLDKLSNDRATKKKTAAQLDAEIAEAQLRQRAEDSTWRTFSDSLTPAEYRVLTSFGRTAYGFWYDAQRRPGP